MLKLILIDISTDFCTAAQDYFGEYNEVTVLNARFEQIKEFDCVVSPANSFGLMDGGFDAVLTRFFGAQLMMRAQERIIEDYRGEQPVGTCMIVETEHDKHPFLAHAPTMRVPMTIAHTDNVYKAMAAILLAVHQHNQKETQKINSVLCTGLGTGAGGVHYKQAARQMYLAYKNFLNPPAYINWQFADQRQSEIRFGGDDGFNYPADWV